MLMQQSWEKQNLLCLFLSLKRQLQCPEKKKMEINTLQPRWRCTVLWGLKGNVRISDCWHPELQLLGGVQYQGYILQKQILSWEHFILFSFLAHVSQRDKWKPQRKTAALELKESKLSFLTEPENRMFWSIYTKDIWPIFRDSEYDPMCFSRTWYGTLFDTLVDSGSALQILIIIISVSAGSQWLERHFYQLFKYGALMILGGGNQTFIVTHDLCEIT